MDIEAMDLRINKGRGKLRNKERKYENGIGGELYE
jgi:hypothetical protein